MQVKCDYCGSWMEDTDEKCPNCSAANAKLTRVAKKTPTTIAELQDWYKARNLPPYSTTRFFIGENYEGAKAFGIYEECGEYIVYKNKADGSRAIRYRGKDEAYAVNELYLRLKEEILNQKNLNAGKRSVPQSSRSLESSSESFWDKFKSAVRRPLGCFGTVIAFLIVLVTIVAVVDSKKAQTCSYYLSSDGSTVYYHFGFAPSSYGLKNTDEEWWRTDVSNPSWTLYDVPTDKHGFPEGLSKDNLCGYLGEYSSMLSETGLPSGDATDAAFDINQQRAFLDLHHSAPSSSAYYVANGNSYYYLDDSHGSSFGTSDNSGWYLYDSDTGWNYYCSGDDHEALGDELWYNDDKYLLGSSYDNYTAYVSGNVYNFTDEEAAYWSAAAMASTFEDTTWYGEKIAADNAYDAYQEELQASKSSSSSSDDSSWDWSSSDSWDSGGTDWSSDW